MAALALVGPGAQAFRRLDALPQDGPGTLLLPTLADLYEETELFGLPDLTPAQGDYAADLAVSLGVPSSATFRSDTPAGVSPRCVYKCLTES